MNDFIWVVWALCILTAVVGFVVVCRGNKAALAHLEESSFLHSMPSFEHQHCDKEHAGIQCQKHYRTESGLAVVILTTGKPGPFPVAGYILTTGAQLQWDKFGKTQNTESGLNLVEVQP